MLMCYATNSNKWKFIDGQWPTFIEELRNVQLGLATNGVNPFGEKQSTWSTSPVLLTNYNIPPWLTTKKYFIMLLLIILGPNCVTGEAFDVYLQPLIEELKQLWEVEVPTRDVSQFNGDVHFNMQAILLRTMHNLLAYGIVAGCAVEGYQRMSNLRTQHNDMKVTSIIEKCILCPTKEVVANGTCFSTSHNII